MNRNWKAGCGSTIVQSFRNMEGLPFSFGARQEGAGKAVQCTASVMVYTRRRGRHNVVGGYWMRRGCVVSVQLCLYRHQISGDSPHHRRATCSQFQKNEHLGEFLLVLKRWVHSGRDQMMRLQRTTAINDSRPHSLNWPDEQTDIITSHCMLTQPTPWRESLQNIAQIHRQIKDPELRTGPPGMLPNGRGRSKKR